MTPYQQLESHYALLGKLAGAGSLLFPGTQRDHAPRLDGSACGDHPGTDKPLAFARLHRRSPPWSRAAP
jgi:hypothetical protein